MLVRVCVLYTRSTPYAQPLEHARTCAKVPECVALNGPARARRQLGGEAVHGAHGEAFVLGGGALPTPTKVRREAAGIAPPGRKGGRRSI